MNHNTKQRLIIVALLVVFIAICLIIVVAYNQAAAPFRDLPPMAFNFPLSKKEARYPDSTYIPDTSRIYEYDLATKRATLHFIDELEWLDADMAEKLVLGRMGDTIVELDLTDDSIRELGPASYQDQPLEFVRQRPGTGDYCGITKSGKLVLWNQVSEEFVLLKAMDWNGNSFGCSWSGDGKQLHIPDETGIEILDMDTLKETHWLTLPIHYPKIGEYPSYKNAFAVSQSQNTVVYCTAEEKLILAKISGDGRDIDAVELGEFENDCAFAILDDHTVVFVCEYLRLHHRHLLRPSLFRQRGGGRAFAHGGGTAIYGLYHRLLPAAPAADQDRAAKFPDGGAAQAGRGGGGLSAAGGGPGCRLPARYAPPSDGYQRLPGGKQPPSGRGLYQAGTNGHRGHHPQALLRK